MALFSSHPPVDQKRVLAAIEAAERSTSGEIRVVIAREEAPDPVVAAQRHFERLGMTETAQRNGVLIFFAPPSHTFAVIGDRGVHEQCGDTFWSELSAAMTERFKSGDFTGGLVLGIERAGELLAKHFPRQGDDKNELPNKIEEA